MPGGQTVDREAVEAQGWDIAPATASQPGPDEGLPVHICIFLALSAEFLPMRHRAPRTLMLPAHTAGMLVRHRDGARPPSAHLADDAAKPVIGVGRGGPERFGWAG